jgi:hypothetical protein
VDYVELMLGVELGQIGHRLHGDAQLSLGTAIENGDFHCDFSYWLFDDFLQARQDSR